MDFHAYEKKCIHLYCILSVLLFLFFTESPAQDSSTTVPDSVPHYKVKVTFYDFHADETNPAFQFSGPPARVDEGLVLYELDAERKPVANPDLNKWQIEQRASEVDRWFRPWEAGIIDTLIFPADTVWSWTGSGESSMEVTPADTLIADTLYKNVIIEDSITFVWNPYQETTYESFQALEVSYDTLMDGTIDTIQFYYPEYQDVVHPPNEKRYKFSSKEFFPLNGIGFGNEGFTGQQHKRNYSFTMEIKNRIEYNGGEQMFVAGDDDIWVFVDNKLALDLGGLHARTAGHLYFDSLGLEQGQIYTFDLFFAERHSEGSSLTIATDIEFIGELPAQDTTTQDTTGQDTTGATTTEGTTEESSGCGNCGSGIGLAFIPPVALRLRKKFRKKRK
jgi:fibro-slime domain-containing protein